jgi:hypothetical protein
LLLGLAQALSKGLSLAYQSPMAGQILDGFSMADVFRQAISRATRH